MATAASPAGVPAKAEKPVRVARKLETPDNLPKRRRVGRRVDDGYAIAAMRVLRGETNVREPFDGTGGTESKRFHDSILRPTARVTDIGPGR